MQVLEIKTIINKINQKEIFEAQTPDLALSIKISDYVPFIFTALHSGHNLRKDLVEKCLLNDYERWYEEDPKTDEFISLLPVTLISNDSRYEYDLNRSEKEAIYETAWGKIVWKAPLDEEERELSLAKYRNFYKVAEALIRMIESMFSRVFVFDIHSYNYKRIQRETPVFNLGTKGVDEKRYKKEIDTFINHLEKIQLPGIQTAVKKNDVFQGRGHFALHISKHFRSTLVFPLEIKKVYCDEMTGEVFEKMVTALKDKLENAMVTLIEPEN